MTRFVRNHRLFTISLVGLTLSLWVGSRALEPPHHEGIRAYGGHLTPRMEQALVEVNDGLRNAQTILHAHPGRLLFMDERQQVREYSFAFRTLWCDNVPLISGVESFIFEYRDNTGNLLTRTEKYLKEVSTIGYTIHVTRGEKDVLSNAEIHIMKRSPS